MTHSTLKELFLEKREAYLSYCIKCGNCLKVCPIVSRSKYKDEDPEELQKKRISFLEMGSFSQEAYDLAYLCMICDLCVLSCPKDLYPPLINSVIQVELTKKGYKVPPYAHFISPDNKKGLMNFLLTLQINPSQYRWHISPPKEPKNTEVVFFASCYSLAQCDKIFTTIDVLERMGVDFVTLAGGENYCCAISYVLLGDMEKADKVIKDTIKAFSSFRPKKVIVGCPTCIWWFKEVCAQYLTYPFEFQHLTQFLADNIELLSFPPCSDSQTITIHDACHLGRGVGEYEAPRKILRSVPGVKIVEMEHKKENALCCGALPALYDPETGGRVVIDRLNEAQATGADFLVSICPFCHLTFSPFQVKYPFKMSNFIEIIGKALGIEYEDKLEKYRQWKDIDRIMEDAKENISQGPFTEEEIRQLLPILFS